MRQQGVLFSLFAVVFLAFATLAMGGGSCEFLSDAPAQFTIPQNTKSVLVDHYFRIYYPAGDTFFQDTDRNDIPDVLDSKVEVIQRSRYFLQTELGWNLPATHAEMGHPEMNVYFVSSGKRLMATTVHEKGLALLFHRSVLNSPDFTALWIHQLAHAAELEYKTGGDPWFYEATAGWMEGQFEGYSASTLKAQTMRLEHPEISINDASPDSALGASRFLDVLARPVRDVIRQVWEQWSYTKDERVEETLANVLAINHLPDLESYLQNFFLVFAPGHDLDRDTEIVLRPYSAVVFQGLPDQASGGARVTFVPEGGMHYGTCILFYSQGEKSGTLSMKRGLTDASSALLPFGGMEHYRYVLVNSSASELRGTLQKEFDASIPGVLEYFHVNPQEGGVQIEWKTARENGVAFWNLYRVGNGLKERLNAFPIPAAIQSDEGVHYMFFDEAEGFLYSLEAVTSDGYPSPLAPADAPR